MWVELYQNMNLHQTSRRLRLVPIVKRYVYGAFYSEATNPTTQATPTLAHVPILTKEIVSLFQPYPGKTFIDMTFGAGGHSAALLDACPDISVIGLDRDTLASQYATQLQSRFGRDKVRLLHGSFTDIIQLLTEKDLPAVNMADAVLFDVGASTMQYNSRKRGFSLKSNSPLDMRMNRKENTPTAADLVNKLTETDIYRILKKYGQERYSRQIARHIVEYRQMMGPIMTTRDLQDLVCEVYRNAEEDGPTDKLGRRRHPATLTFQALRIFVNDELNQLYNGLKVAHRLLKPSGVCAAITFHTLEHNIVHQVFNTEHIFHKEKFVTPDLYNNIQSFPWKCDRRVTKPSDREVNENPKSRSAELRVAYKINV